MWAKHFVFVMDGWMVDGCSWLVWCLTIIIRTVNTKTNPIVNVMALHDKLIAFSIISEHSTWGGGTITRHGQCGPTVATALPSLVPRLAHHPLQHLHLPTTPPGHFLSDSERSSLLFLISVKVSYRELQLMFYYLIIFMNQPNIAVNASLLLTQSGILWLIIFLFRLSCSASSSGARL